MKTWVLMGEQFEDFRQKEKIKDVSSLDRTTPRNKRPLKATIDDRFYSQEEINQRKIEKSIQNKTFGT